MVTFLLVVQLLPDGMQALLLYEREAMAQGQWWRLLSAHFVHLSWMHVLVNSLGLLLAVGLFPRLFAGRLWLPVLLLLCLAVSVGLLQWSTEVAWYGGFSGVLMGLYVFAALQSWSRDRLVSLLVLTIISIKIAQEQFWSSGLSVIDISVVVDAHLYGALAALGLCANAHALSGLCQYKWRLAA